MESRSPLPSPRYLSPLMLEQWRLNEGAYGHNSNNQPALRLEGFIMKHPHVCRTKEGIWLLSLFPKHRRTPRDRI